MPAPTIAEKYVAGYVFDANGLPDDGATVSATLSSRIVNVANNYVIENDEPETTTVQGDGRWVMTLHPTNFPTDQSDDALYWTIREPSGHSEVITIPYDHAQGGTDETAIPYTSLIEDPGNLPDPGDTTLSDRVATIETVLDLMNSLNAVGLAALTTPVDTDLVEAATAASANATITVAGLMSATDKEKLDAVNVNRLVVLDADGGGIVVPSRADYATAIASGSGRMWVGATDNQLKVRVASSTTALAPALDAPAWQASADVTVTAAIPPATPQTLTSFTVEANALYEIRGLVGYTAEATVDLRMGFGGIPSLATLIWGYTGPEASRAASTSTGSINSTRRSGTSTLTFGGVGMTASDGVLAHVVGTLRTGVNGGTLTVLAQKENTGTNPVILAGTLYYLTRLL